MVEETKPSSMKNYCTASSTSTAADSKSRRERAVEFQLPTEGTRGNNSQEKPQQQQLPPQPQLLQQLRTTTTASSSPSSALSSSHSSRRLLRTRSSSSVTNSSKFDSNLLSRAVSDAGRWAYGIMLVEVWALSGDRTYLFRPESGWWIDPVYHSQCHNPNDQQSQRSSSSSSSCQVCRLVDPNCPDYVAPAHLSPGVGLPGVLWTQAVSTASWTRSFRETLASRILGERGIGSGGPAPAPSHEGSHLLHLPEHYYSHIVWRSVPQLEADPDQPWNPRLKLLASLGLGLAAAVPFNLHGVDQGIVIYMARDGVDRSRLQSESNEAYLISAADLIAAAYALRGPRQQVVQNRRKELSDALYRVRKKIAWIRRMGWDLKDYVNRAQAAGQDQQQVYNSKDSSSWIRCRLCTSSRVLVLANQNFVALVKKSRGGGSAPPPSFSWGQTFLTFVGTFVTLIAITGLHVLSVQGLGSDFGVILGPFGAFMTLLYGLTAAPASQPRNAFLGQTVSMTISLALTYFTHSSMPIWIRQSLAASLAVSAMVKLGVTHPPAGASAVILASGGGTLGNVALTLVGTCLAIAVSTLINNLSSKRQYPIYWLGCSEVPTLRSVLDTMHGLVSAVANKTPTFFQKAIPDPSWSYVNKRNEDVKEPSRELSKAPSPQNSFTQEMYTIDEPSV